MTDCKFEPGKTYKTRDGRVALIYCVDAPGNYPIHGRIEKRIEDTPYSWKLDGTQSSYNCSSDLMLPEPKRLKLKRWMNVCSFGIGFFADKKVAERNVFDDTLRTAVPCWVTEILPGEEGYDDE